MYRIGIDIGGTAIKCGLIESNKVVCKEFVKTNPDDVISGIKKSLENVLNAGKISPDSIEKIVIGVPGIIENGIVLYSANVKLAGIDLRKEISKFTSIPVDVRNDGDMATLAEYVLGVGRGYKNMIMLTLGTGVGGGIIIDGKLYSGPATSELGHIPFIYGGEPCGCGGSGCVERYVSCSALIRLAKEIMQGNSTPLSDIANLQVSDIDKMYTQGDPIAIKIVEEYSNRLATALAGYSNIFRPGLIVIGGGMTHAPNIINCAIEKLKQMNYGYKNAPSVDIKIASLGNLAGILGAVI